MSLIYCYSTKSKLLSIEAMLYSYMNQYDFFSWKPKICVIERKGNHWGVYYCEKSIKESQKICKDIFARGDFSNVVLTTLEAQIDNLNTMMHLFKNKEFLSQKICREYFETYSKFLHHYSFSNEFCFAGVEEYVLKNLVKDVGEEKAHSLLYTSQGFKDTDSYAAYKKLEEIKYNYMESRAINNEELEKYVNKYAYLFDKNIQMNDEEYVKELIYNHANSMNAYDNNRYLQNYKYTDFLCEEIVYEDVNKLMKVRKLRLLMRETMMKFNYNFSGLLNNTMELLYGKYTSEYERADLIRNLSKEDFYRIDNIDIVSILKKRINTLIYADGYIYTPDQCTTLNGIDESTVYANHTLKGRVVCGEGIINGIVRTCYTDNTSNNDINCKYIYVTKSLHPRDLLILDQVSAVIVDEGGILSHSSIIAKELSIPCIINTRQASLILSDGDKVSIDLDVGEVFILSNNETCRYESCLRKLNIDIVDKRLFGNKCVNLCSYIDNFRIADGYVIDSGTIEVLFQEMKKNSFSGLSAHDIKEIQNLFPVILRSSSVCEDTDHATGAGLLESITDITSIKHVYNAIMEICASSRTKAFQLYAQKNGLDNSLFPSVVIQRYYDFFALGTILVLKDEAIIEYKSKLSNEVQDFKLKKQEMEYITTDHNRNDLLAFIVNEAYILIKSLENDLIEFGIEKKQFYLLQVRKRGNKNV